MNYTLAEPQRFGAIDDAELRAEIREDDLTYLEGCNYLVIDQGDHFSGSVNQDAAAGFVVRGVIPTWSVSLFWATAP